MDLYGPISGLVYFYNANMFTGTRYRLYAVDYMTIPRSHAIGVITKYVHLDKQRLQLPSILSINPTLLI